MRPLYETSGIDKEKDLSTSCGLTVQPHLAALLHLLHSHSQPLHLHAILDTDPLSNLFNSLRYSMAAIPIVRTMLSAVREEAVVITSELATTSRTATTEIIASSSRTVVQETPAALRSAAEISARDAIPGQLPQYYQTPELTDRHFPPFAPPFSQSTSPPRDRRPRSISRPIAYCRDTGAGSRSIGARSPVECKSDRSRGTDRGSH